MARRHGLNMKVVLLALALCGPSFAESRVPSDYTQFVTQFPDLATPLEANDFRHPAEADMVETLTSSNPGIRNLIEDTKKDQLKQVHDKDMLYRLDAVEVGPKQHPDVHKAALDCAAALGLHTNFKVFIMSNPQMQDDVFGFPKHGHYGNSFGPFTILLTSGMVKALSADELKFVIGREMGHVKANHRFYTALAFAYQRELDKLPRIFPEDKTTKAPGLGGLLTFFFTKCQKPSRITEFTADRGGLVCIRKPLVGVSALAKIARGDLEGTPGFNLEAYLEQVQNAANDMTPHEAEDMAGTDGYMPFILNRVGEASRFGQTEAYKALVDRATVNPFLMEVETLFSIGTGLAYWTQRLADFKADPHTVSMDPLQVQVIVKDLTAKIDRRQKAFTELETMTLNHVEALGLATENTRFSDLIGTARRRGDARPFKSAFTKLTEQIQFALSQPNVPETQIIALEAKKAAIERVKDLAPKPTPRPPNAPPAWVETSDLPALVESTVATLRDAATNGTHEQFIFQFDTLRPKLKEAALKLVTTMPREDRVRFADLIGNFGGHVASLVNEVQAAGNDPNALGAVFDRNFDSARAMLRVVPLFVIRRALNRYAGVDVKRTIN